MSQSQAALIVSGACHVRSHYQKLKEALESRGIRTICETLPTNNNAQPPTATLRDDIDFVKSIVAREAAAGTHVTVIAHSWGGMVSSGALADFAVPRGSSDGGVTDLVFMCAFLPKEGEALTDILGGAAPPYIDEQDGILLWRDPIHHLYNDLEAEEAAWAESLRVTHGAGPHSTPLDVPVVSWRTIPLTYVVCENDKAVPAPFQDMMLGRVESDGISVKCYRIPSSHSPFLRMPDRMADIIEEVMGKCV